MPRINVLPKHIADLIAAGEVVERPSSVVKEAVENSIDAGATIITVEIQHGGITYIRITDNGCGILRDDIRNAFVSHATSKIATADDLDAIGTLGFRGEALASVSAVSKVEVLTKAREESIGTHYRIEGGEEILLDDAGCPDGTTLIVRDLFFNTPARMKFLKKDVSEANAVAGVIDRVALSHPEISFRFIRDGKETLLTPGDGKLTSAIYAVFGKEFANSLIEIDYSLNGVSAKGYISKPVYSRANRNMQMFFLNSRLVKTQTGSVALTESYRNSIMAGKFPACVINLTVPNEAVDVNVHPSKLEVRFANEKAVYDCIYYGVKNALNKEKERPQVELEKVLSNPKFAKPQMFVPEKAEQIKFIPQKQEQKIQVKEEIRIQPEKEKINSYQPKVNHTTAFLAQPETVYETDEVKDEQTVQKPKITVFTPPAVKEEIKEEVKEEAAVEVQGTEDTVVQETMPVVQPEIKEEQPVIPEFRIVGEAFKTYIFAECEGKLMIIDKHAAHERMIYNELKKSTDGIFMQSLMIPVTVTLSKEEYDVIVNNLEILEKAGFAVEAFGTSSVIVRECPSVIEAADVENLLIETATYLLQNKNDLISEKLDWIFHSSACRAAIKAGDKTDRYELEKFTAKLLADESVRYCPHGRPVLAELTKRELEKFFGRIQ
ncbi:MAG: DNA mismatch repair endonuclease MutL [Clostridia bacterium]|nr:DNA mismatch repair endonuclease MutL [Clostridia bacterium]